MVRTPTTGSTSPSSPATTCFRRTVCRRESQRGTVLADFDVDDETTRWAVEAARAADDKKGEDTVVLTVGAILALTEHFVITHGTNPRQVRTIADEVEHHLTDLGGPKPIRIEGLDDLTWVLMDYGDFVVHVFHEEARRYYELERLWADVPTVDWRP